jgi:hypothetical protein
MLLRYQEYLELSCLESTHEVLLGLLTGAQGYSVSLCQTSHVAIQLMSVNIPMA